jgi:hypothetical protein
MGIDDDTLRKHFSGELQNGRIYIEGMMIDVLTQKMREGHVPSMRLLKELMEVHPERPAKPADKPKAPVLGKKAQQASDAARPPEGWGDLLDDVRLN